MSLRSARSGTRRTTPLLASGAAVIGLLAFGMSAPAQAAEQTVSDAVFDWSINDESTGGAYFGGCNFLVAGTAKDAGSARVWNANDAGELYPVDADGKFADGNVSIVKSSGELNSFADRCKTGESVAVNGKVNAEAENNHTGDKVSITKGTGTIDPDADNATIQWEGSWTFAYYGGMTYWTISDPKLEVKDGKGTVTGTYSGFGADMDDPSIWEKLSPVDGEIIEIQNGSVDVTEDGFTFTPDYLGVETNTDGRNPQSPKSDENASWWGAMPQDWIDFNVKTGQDSYWYTTAGAATSIQPRKKANPVTVEYTAEAPAVELTTSHSLKSADVETGLTVNVKGEGYDRLPNSSIGMPAAGVYAAVVDRDLASDDIGTDNVAGVGYIKSDQITEGKLDADINAETARLSKDKNYDTVIWVAHGFAQGEALLYREPIELTADQKEALFPDDNGTDEDNGTSDDSSAKDGTSDDDAKDGTADDNAKDGTSDDSSAKDGTSDDNAKDGTSDDTSAKDGTSDDNAKDGTSDDTSAKDGTSDDDSAKDGTSDDDSSKDGAEDQPAAPKVSNQTVPVNGEIKGSADPNSEVTLSWKPAQGGKQNATSTSADVPSEGTVTVQANAQGDFTAKAPTQAGTYAYSAVASVADIPSEPTTFTVTVQAQEEENSAGSADGATDEPTEEPNPGSGSEGTSSGSGNESSGASNGSGSNGSATSGNGSGSSSSTSGDLPRTGANLISLPIAVGLIILGASTVLISRRRKH